MRQLKPSCKPQVYTSLPADEKFKLCLKASIDPIAFWEDPRMGNLTLWESQKATLRQFYELDDSQTRRYNELLFAAGMKSAKTTTAALILLTELKNLLMMDNPQKKYNLLANEEISFVGVANTYEQCLRTIYMKVKGLVENSPFFCSFAEDVNVTEEKMSFPKKLSIWPLGSNLKANVGMTVKVFVADEINFSARETYQTPPDVLFNRLGKATTPFKPFKEDIKVAISSRSGANDFLSKRIELTREQGIKTTMILEKTTIECNPTVTKESIENERLMDEEGYIQDYGFGVGREGNSFFKQVTLDLLKTWNKRNLFEGEPRFGRKGAFVPDINPEKIKYDPDAVYYGLFNDPATVRDGYGLTLMHNTIYDELVVDGMTVFRSNVAEEIDPVAVKDVILKIVGKLPIEVFAYDIYMYNELRDQLTDEGINLWQHQLKKADWLKFKDRIHTKRIRGPMNDYAMQEFENLIVRGEKVDHITGGSKDMIDALCLGVAYFDQDEKPELLENEIMVMQGVK